MTTGVGVATLSADDPVISGRTGRGVRIAVLDSGINPGNPHVTPPAQEFALLENGGKGPDALDLLGHGTAVTAAIQEKAPESEIVVIKIFHETLSTDVDTLVRGLDAAVDLGARIVNLSLGIPGAAADEGITDAVERAQRQGSVIVSPREHRGLRWWPGAFPGVAGVLLDWGCPRQELRMMRDSAGEPIFRASGLPRPIPGVPPDRNARGISFATANVTGLLARLMEGSPALGSTDGIADRLMEAPP